MTFVSFKNDYLFFEWPIPPLSSKLCLLAWSIRARPHSSFLIYKALHNFLLPYQPDVRFSTGLLISRWSLLFTSH
jgi:hypothetical protein